MQMQEWRCMMHGEGDVKRVLSGLAWEGVMLPNVTKAWERGRDQGSEGKGEGVTSWREGGFGEGGLASDKVCWGWGEARDRVGAKHWRVRDAVKVVFVVSHHALTWSWRGEEACVVPLPCCGVATVWLGVVSFEGDEENSRCS
ncbi:hypothetical protein PIB30_018301 [Stylosanthes scabra]|uniref:Uncharacterized protein n=1 Tax=Stylosanthes scabra TaxID=79078 RepID=A0ABU6Y685_9FABA|nr:hypothetical protein [Stylosanthes scabra]